LPGLADIAVSLGLAPASLAALLDRQLRGAVVAANRKNPELIRMHLEGIGHEFWVGRGERIFARRAGGPRGLSARCAAS
jgi:hypothetical protein